MTTHNNQKYRTNKVEEFMNNLNHPLKEEIEAVRNIIKSANSELTEQIKWNAPSYSVEDKDRITFNLHGKGFFRIIFHCGAKVKEGSSKDQLFVDTTGLLDWVSPDRAIMKFTNKSDVIKNEENLREIITKWLKITL